MPLDELIFDQTTRQQVKFSFPCKTTLYRDADGNHVLVGKRFQGEGKGTGVILATWAIEALQSLEIPEHQKQVSLQNKQYGWHWKGHLRELPAKESLPSSNIARHGPSNIIVIEPDELDLKSMDYIAPPANGFHRFTSAFPRPDSYFAPEEVEMLPEAVLALPIDKPEALDLRTFLKKNGRSPNWLPNVEDLTALAKARGYTLVIDSEGFRAYQHG